MAAWSRSAGSTPLSDPADRGDPVHALVDHLFRRQSGRLTASLVRSFGPARLDLAEEVVQEALIRALKRWPFHGVPDEPTAWLHRVARNLALDRLRRDGRFAEREESVRRELYAEGVQGSDSSLGTHAVEFDGEFDDDQLRLIFLCCHPDLPRDARVALTLKTVLGFSVPEIARAFLTARPTVAQRLVRAQRRIRDLALPFELPPPERLGERLDTVLEALYLLFNEGYGAHQGAHLVRAELCAEALRLVDLLAERPATDRPATHALAALCFLQASRLPARVDAAGGLVLLAEQDRALWDRRAIARGLRHLDRARAGDEQTSYHLQAGIAALHACEADAESTDWPTILRLYDRLLARQPSPIVALNRAVALARVEGARAALDEVERIAADPALADYYLLPAVRGDLLLDLGDSAEAARSFRTALERPASEPERRFLERRLAEAEERRAVL